MALEVAWNFDEASGAVVDYSGNNRGFALTGTTARTAAGGGYTYGGTLPNRKGLIQTTTGIQLGPSMTGLNSTSRTFEAWVKTQTTDPSWMLEWYNTANDTGAWGLLLLSTVWSFRAKNAANTAFPVTLTKDSVAFHHIAATHDGSVMKVYRDGVQVGSNVSIPSALMTADVMRVFDTAQGGTLSDTRIYSHVLTATEINTDMATPVTAQTPGFTGWGIPL